MRHQIFLTPYLVLTFNTREIGPVLILDTVLALHPGVELTPISASGVCTIIMHQVVSSRK